MDKYMNHIFLRERGTTALLLTKIIYKEKTRFIAK